VTEGRAKHARRVLVVDDDDMLRRILARTLRRTYGVIEVGNAESALEMLAGGQSFDVILCDLNLDGMSGSQFLKQLTIRHPDHAARTIVMSGAPRGTLDEELLLRLEARFVEKPASARVIESAIESVLRAA